MRADNTAIAWAAGLFEGEGCITTYLTYNYDKAGNRKGNGFPVVRLQLKMCDRDIIERFGQVVGISKCAGPYGTRKENWRPAYEWHCSKRQDVERIILAFLSYLGERRAYKALNALDTIDKL